ncbi:MAG: di-heme-cytochrome C peroxidase [Pseudomonadota bacterium]
MNTLMRSLACLSLAAALAACAPQLPENTPVSEARWLEQNWTPDARYWFHHTTQGTSTLPVPYDWFVALEQPRLWLFGEPPMLTDSDYLRRFGFIPSPASFDLETEALAAYGYSAADKEAYGVRAYDYNEAKFPGNPHGLPVGFARLQGAVDPVNDMPLPDQIGLTCAACHTGHLEYNGVSLRVDGGPAVTNLGKFRESLALAVAYTKIVPFRFGRFAERVLGPDHTAEQEAALERSFDTLIERLKAVKEITDPVFAQNVEEGYTRLDALNRIGNQVFFHDLYVPGADNSEAIGNLAPITAPVNFPHIWDTSWFLWVQYDASIMQPMVRNAGEALGVRAKVNLVKPGESLYRSAVEVEEVFQLEQLLAGAYPFGGNREPGFKGLWAPKWPEDVLGEIDRDKAVRGHELYREHCQECHLPAVNDRAFWENERWAQLGGKGQKYLNLVEKQVDAMGTDPAQAAVMVDRHVKVPAHLEIDPGALCDGQPSGVVTETTFALALAVVVEKTAEKWYDDHGIPEAERNRMNGDRPNCIVGVHKYKARPLDGIWATAPYLHNGAVPNLYEMLSPAAERSKTFTLGSRLFDPEKVGYRTESIPGGFLLDTSLPGNSNQGHQFKDGPLEAGVLGPTLSHEERMDLIEYLKTI